MFGMAAIHSACCCQFVWLSRSHRSNQRVYHPSADRLHLVRRLGQEAHQRQLRKRSAVQVLLCSTDLVTGNTPSSCLHLQVLAGLPRPAGSATYITQTLRAGTVQEHAGTVIIFGYGQSRLCAAAPQETAESSTVFRDVKHGATVIAGGDVLVWGK